MVVTTSPIAYVLRENLCGGNIATKPRPSVSSGGIADKRERSLAKNIWQIFYMRSDAKSHRQFLPYVLAQFDGRNIAVKILTNLFTHIPCAIQILYLYLLHQIWTDGKANRCNFIQSVESDSLKFDRFFDKLKLYIFANSCLNWTGNMMCYSYKNPIRTMQIIYLNV